jgi:cell wall-associated NlpC family hydrolase
LRVRALGAVLCWSLPVAAVAVAPDHPGATSSTPVAGGVAAQTKVSTSASGGATPIATAPKKPLHLSPVTAKTPSLTYHGPIYQKTATGEVVPYAPPAPAAPGQASTPTGGSPVVGVAATATTKPNLLVPGSLARYVGGLAAAPMSAPAPVQAAVWAGNQIIGLPYIFGGGHASFSSPGYDCSGTVSFALHGASLLQAPEDSSEFEAWGSHGVGRWITVFSNPGHAYMTVAGLRLDTSAADDPSAQQGPRWRPLRTGNGGYRVRHPLGL